MVNQSQIYRFESTVTLLDFGRMSYCVAYVPASTLKKLPLAEFPRLRIQGEVNGHSFRGALQPAGEGRYYLMLSKRMLKLARVSNQDRILVEFQIDDQDAVDVPRELDEALQRSPRALEAWSQLTPGRQRGLCHMISTAKLPATRRKRVEALLDELVEQADQRTR